MADTLTATFDSILKVKNVNLEVIVVDDGSEDNFQSVIYSYESRFNSLKNISLKIDSLSKNSGRAVAVNKGIKLATGIYVTLIDADDTINSSELVKLWKSAKSNQADLIIGQFKVVDDNGNLLSRRSLKSDTNQKKLIQKIAFSPLAPIHLNAILIKRDFLKEVGDMDKKNFKSEDKDLTIRLLRKANTISISDSYHYLYKKHKLPKKRILFKRIEWLIYRQKTINNNYKGVTKFVSMPLQLTYDLGKLMYEMFIGYRN